MKRFTTAAPRLSMLMGVAWTLVAVPAIAAPLTMSLTAASPQVHGDGSTPVDLTIEVRPVDIARQLTDLTVVASAGSIGDIRNSGPGVFVVSFVPPRVGASLGIELEASARFGSTRLRARHRLTASAAADGAPQTTSRGPLAIQVPSRLVLGREHSMPLHLTAGSGVAPRLLVNTGWISPLRASGDGRWTASYTPPLEKLPQVLIIAATDMRGALLDWVTVALDGQAEVATTSEPLSDVRVQVGDTIYGPVRSDARGRSSLPIVVPPGVEVAATIASDRRGGVERGELNLGVRPMGRLLSLCDEDAQALTILALDGAGRPDTGAPLALTASLGALSAPLSTAPGVYVAALSLPASVGLGERVVMQARLANTASAPAACEMVVRAGPPSRLTVTLEPSTYVAGSGSPIAVTIDAIDRAGRPTAAELATSVDLGALSPLRQVEPGRYQAQWRVPDQLLGKRMAFITVRDGASPLVQEASLTLVPGRPAGLVVRAAATDLEADGDTTTSVFAELSDAAGNAIDDAQLEARANGDLSAFAYRRDIGAYEATYQATRSHAAGGDTVAVRHGASQLESSVRLTLRPSLSAFSLGLRGGYVVNFGSLSSPMLAADAMWRLPLWRRRLFAGVEVGYVFAEKTRRIVAADEVSAEIRLVPLLARVGVELPLADLVSVYAGAAAGATVVDRTTTSRVGGRSAATSAHATGSGFAGVHVSAGVGRVAVEVAYRFVSLETPDLEGSAGGLAMSAGYRFVF